MKIKILTISIIVFVFCIFAIFEHVRKADKAVLKVINAAQIEIDLNGNGKTDLGETICIPDIEVFSTQNNFEELIKKLKISNTDAIKLGYLTDEFADNTLSDKRVKVKFSGIEDHNCKYADITVDKSSYKTKLINSGLALYNGEISPKFTQQLEKAKKLNLSILNHKSNKYHKLDCKYGLTAHDAIIIPSRQIPQNAKPCKFCHIDKTKTQKAKPSAKTFPLAISQGNIKMFLTDLTTTLKPSKKCNSMVCRELLNQINSSKKSINIALYGWDNIDEVSKALLNAKSRGVKIQIVHDLSNKNYYPDTKSLVALADKSSFDTPKILMHNKFVIFDEKTVFTGSMNFSSTGLSGFNSNCVFVINSTDIAQIYLQEFEQMLSGKFHQEKSKISHKTVLLNNTKITPLFSPKDKAIVNNVIPLINSAKNYIYIPTFILTHDALAASLINAKNRGVKVQIITDATNVYASRSKIKMLRMAGIPVKTENYAGKMHSKSIIIDDKYIIAGSMNFSNSGENKNDENCLIIEDQRLAKHYREFFEYLWTKIPDKYLKVNPRAESKDSIGSCSDGIDNDYDGKIDLLDEGCR